MNETIKARFEKIRNQTRDLCKPLEPEDFILQSMPDASPAKWHLAHSTWFFETFVLMPHAESYEAFHPHFNFLFNSYYNAIGARHPRPERGMLSRPTIQQVFDYRRHVDEALGKFLDDNIPAEIVPIVELGLNHEQQHQELLLTDLKHAFSLNSLSPQYRPSSDVPQSSPVTLEWHLIRGGLREIGYQGDGFAFDNETPRHRVYVNDFQIGSRMVTNAEFIVFVRDGGYRRAECWLSDGWDVVQLRGWKMPLYWFEDNGNFEQFTLSGMRPLELNEPVTHISFYEADAYARWAKARLLTEAEWEIAAEGEPISGNFVEHQIFHPRAAVDADGLQQLYGDVWEWTSSPYSAYPGYQPAAGAIGEYNGKFMCNQFVLRGGSCATPQSHIRPTYRNFFHPDKRWQFTGIRLARDA